MDREHSVCKGPGACCVSVQTPRNFVLLNPQNQTQEMNYDSLGEMGWADFHDLQCQGVQHFSAVGVQCNSSPKEGKTGFHELSGQMHTQMLSEQVRHTLDIGSSRESFVT